MYVRDAKNREEVWLLDHIEAMGLDETAFRSRDYVVAIDEESHEKAGFGRLRVHRTDDGDRAASGRRVEADEVVELTSIGVLENWRGRGVGAHVVERLVEYAGDDDFETVYALTGEPEYPAQFGFERIEPSELPQVLRRRLDEEQEETAPDAVPMALDVADFSMPQAFRDRFKRAKEADEDEEAEPVEGPEDFGIDPTRRPTSTTLDNCPPLRMAGSAAVGPRRRETIGGPPRQGLRDRRRRPRYVRPGGSGADPGCPR